MTRAKALLVMLAAFVLAANAFAAQPVKREDLGRSVKLTILVDKVMLPTEKWVCKEWIVKEAAAAGFNVFSPRSGYDRLDEVKLVAKWCEKYGIYHMPWMRGTLAVPKDAQADGKRLVWASGNEQPLWSPNSDEFWEWTHRYIVEYAKISATHKGLMGVFLDYENYAPGKQGNCYALSYDDIIMGKFAQAKGVELPKLELKARKKWLEDQGLHEEFDKFQVNHWRERARTLRQAVDAYNPMFQFCVYPAPGTRFMIEGTYAEWSTPAAPIILADPWTYGRPSRFLPEADSLESNKKTLLRGIETAKKEGVPFIYSGGIDPCVRGADAEFSGKNAVMISDVTDGYWIFYEGPKFDKDHKDYWKWFTWANKNIAAGNLAAWHEPRTTPEDWSIVMLDSAKGQDRLTPPAVTGEVVKFPVVKMRRENMILVAAKAGLKAEIVLQNHPLAHYESLLVWDLRDSKMAKLASAKIAHGKSGTISFTPEVDGMYIIGASAGSCGFSVVSANVPVALYAADRLQLLGGAKRLYFKVPGDVKEFTLKIKGSGGETVRVNVFDPEGKQAATAQTTLAKQKVKFQVAAGAHAGGTWALEVTKADEGALEDNSVTLDPKLLPVLSLTPEQVFNVKAKE